jgi:hypothetical protein
MPENRYFTVREAREVRVSASNMIDAMKVAQAAFRGEDHDFRDIGGMVRDPVRDVQLDIKEDGYG